MLAANVCDEMLLYDYHFAFWPETLLLFLLY